MIADLGLPDADGLEVLLRIGEHAAGAAVVVLTGRSDPELGHEAIRPAASAPAALPGISPTHSRVSDEHGLSRLLDLHRAGAWLATIAAALAHARRPGLHVPCSDHDGARGAVMAATGRAA